MGVQQIVVDDAKAQDDRNSTQGDSQRDSELSAAEFLELRCAAVAGLIFRVERALAVNRQIGVTADAINKANFGDLFASLQGALTEVAILNTVKLFDRSTRRHPIESLPALAEHIYARRTRLRMRDRNRTIQFLAEEGVDADALKLSEDIALTDLLVARLRGMFPDAKRPTLLRQDIVLRGLKAQRDKVIAHSEVIAGDVLPAATLEGLTVLVDLAKRQLGVIAWAYLNTAYVVDDGEYVLTSDAERGASAMRRLLQAAALEVGQPANEG